MRVRAAMVELMPERVVMPPVDAWQEITRTTNRWNLDLMRLRDGEISFDAFARTHLGIVRRLASRWARRCAEQFGSDDAIQETLLEIWRSVDLWDPDRGIPLHAFVRQRVRFKLLGTTSRIMKGREVDGKYVMAVGRRDDSVCDERLPQPDEAVSVHRRYASVIGSMLPEDAEVVMGLVDGKPLQTIKDEVYSRRTAGGAQKKARQVIRYAAAVAAVL